MTIGIRYALMMDDVRDEVNGKQTFVGIYNESMTVQSLPAQLSKLCFVIVATEIPDRQESASFELRSPTGRVINASHGPTFEEALQSNEDNLPLTMVFSYSPLRLDELGEYSFVYIGGKEEQVLYSFNLTKPVTIQS